MRIVDKSDRRTLRFQIRVESRLKMTFKQTFRYICVSKITRSGILEQKLDVNFV